MPVFADWCIVDITRRRGLGPPPDAWPIRPGEMERAAAVGAPLSAGTDDHADGAAGAGTGRPELLATRHRCARCGSCPKDEEHYKLLASFGLGSAMSVPLKSRGKTMGVISLPAAESGRHYTPADLTLAEDLAHRAAAAIENSLLYAEVKQGDRRKDEFLAMLAHELRNPPGADPQRAGVVGHGGLRRRDRRLDAEHAKEQVYHMVRLIDDFLDVSRIMRGRSSFARSGCNWPTWWLAASRPLAP